MLRKAYYVVCTVLLVTLPANNAVSVAQHVEPAVKTPPRVYTSVTDPTSTFLSSLPASYMLLAERHISAGDFEAAEYEVRKIISVLEIESESSNEEPNELLRAATDSLYSIRETLAEDSTVPTKRLRTTFA